MTYDGTYTIEGATSCRGTFVSIKAYFETRDEAVEAQAIFPKSCKAKAFGVSCSDATRGGIEIYAELSNNKVNGGINETGVKRINRALDIILDGEYDVTFPMNYTNSLSEGEIMDWLTPTFDAAEEA